MSLVRASLAGPARAMRGAIRWLSGSTGPAVLYQPRANGSVLSGDHRREPFRRDGRLERPDDRRLLSPEMQFDFAADIAGEGLPPTSTDSLRFATTSASSVRKDLVERIGKTRRYRLTPMGLKLGVLLVKLRMRLFGPLVSLIQQPHDTATPQPTASVDAAYREVVISLDHLSAAFGLQHAA